MYKLCVFVPDSHLEQVKTAMFNAGTGKIGHYDSCCWQTQGQGQFRPLQGNQAFIGNINQLETLNEFKVEMVVSDDLIKTVIHHMKQAHPYEEPAYDTWQLASL